MVQDVLPTQFSDVIVADSSGCAAYPVLWCHCRWWLRMCCLPRSLMSLSLMVQDVLPTPFSDVIVADGSGCAAYPARWCHCRWWFRMCCLPCSLKSSVSDLKLYEMQASRACNFMKLQARLKICRPHKIVWIHLSIKIPSYQYSNYDRHIYIMEIVINGKLGRASLYWPCCRHIGITQVFIFWHCGQRQICNKRPGSNLLHIVILNNIVLLSFCLCKHACFGLTDIWKHETFHHYFPSSNVHQCIFFLCFSTKGQQILEMLRVVARFR